MTTDRELMQWALAALDGYARNCKCEGGGAPCDAAEALRARLAKPEQKPAGWLYKGEVRLSARDLPPDETIPLYTTPPKIFCGCGDQIMPDDGAECGTCVTARSVVKNEWQELTDEEMFAALVQADPLTKRLAPGFEYFARAIEAKLKEKNT
jgi:hypothetical protein